MSRAHRNSRLCSRASLRLSAPAADGVKCSAASKRCSRLESSCHSKVVHIGNKLQPWTGVWYLLDERSVPRMNTKNKQGQKNQTQKTRQKQGPKKQGQHPNMLQKFEEHEHPETRMTR